MHSNEYFGLDISQGHSFSGLVALRVWHSTRGDKQSVPNHIGSISISLI